METTLRAPPRIAGPPLQWSLAAGAGLVAAGAIAVAAPLIGAAAAVAVLGWTQLFAGAVELTHAFEARRERQWPWHLLSGALYVTAGFVLLFRPESLLAVAMVLGSFLLLRSMVLARIAYQLRRTRAWAPFAVDAVASLAFSVLLFAGLPSRAIAFVGIWSGAGLIANGVDRLAVAALTRSQRAPRAHA